MFRPLLLALAAAFSVTLSAGVHADANDAVQELLNSSSGGLVVQLGCGDARQIAELTGHGNWLVQALDTDAAKVDAARKHLHEADLYGPVSADTFDGRHLPYAENLVNLIVAEQLGDVSETEAIRVLAPNGMLCVKKDGEWVRTVKPRPKDIDEWTHYAYDASNNAVAHDEVVAPPGRVQWVDGPHFMRSHEHVPGIYCVVSSGGRIFYILDDVKTNALRATPHWCLVARDAFNGTLLWKQPIAQWFPHIVNWGATPRQLQRKLVAVGDRVYVTLGLHAPLTAVDAATGKAIRTYDDTRGAEEIILHDGVLLAMVRSVTEERIAELDKWVQLVGLETSPLDTRDTADPLVKRLRASENQGQESIVAFDAESGRKLWSKGNSEIDGYRSMSLCAAQDRVLYQNGPEIVCVDLQTGEKQWGTPAAALQLVHGGRVFCAGNERIEGLSLASGAKLWSQKPLLTSIHDVFVAGGSLWIGGFKPFPTKRGPSWGPYFATERDLETGDVLMHIEPDNPGHHHRCYSNKATDRYILGGRRGTEFIDLEKGEVLWNSWVRGVCRYGVMPCNGLLYAPPHACGCYTTVKTEGFFALAPRDPADAVVSETAPTPQRGPAYNTPLSALGSPLSNDAWPTYRHDGERSGSTEGAVPASLKIAWQTKTGNRLSAPTVADGKVFVADVDGHRLCAMDATSGEPAWQFTAGARIDSPPTIAGGRALFGSHDGYVYSVTTGDGTLAWRLLAARRDRRIAADGQVESVSPCIGSVLLHDGQVYATAGRNSYMDTGVDVCRIDPATGELLSRSPVYSPDKETGRQPEQYDQNMMPGSRNDVLTCDAEHVYLQESMFDGKDMIRHGGNPHLFAVTGMLDDAWSHRSYWIFGTVCSLSTGCSGRAKDLIYGRLLALDDDTVYGYGRKNVHWSNQLEDGPYQLFAVPREGGERKWSVSVPLQVRAMVLTRDALFVAGSPVKGGERSGTPRQTDKGLLLAVSTKDGSVSGEVSLDSPPVFDGMAAGGRLYLALETGSVACLAGN
ncbi:MAG: PQQ-binding-like beta-propeller repeat protein [Planctomycetaceae bacterium]|nr:PQQ-binding-like beta-propeller repeat protein [Planctomycetaceae bacterium]